MSIINYSNNDLKNIEAAFVKNGILRHSSSQFLSECLNDYLQTVKAGYQRTLLELRKQFPAEELIQFEISKKNLGFPNSIEEQQIINQYGNLQNYLNYSDENIKKVYEVAQNLINENAYKEAEEIFIFLIYLVPSQGQFWQGLGECWEEDQEYEHANFAYSTAINCNCTNLSYFISACRNLLKMKEIKKAQALIEYGLQNLTDLTGTKILTSILANLKALITEGEE